MRKIAKLSIIAAASLGLVGCGQDTAPPASSGTNPPQHPRCDDGKRCGENERPQ